MKSVTAVIKARGRTPRTIRPERGEEGVTLLELGFSLLIMSLIMTVVITAMSTFLYSTNSAIKIGQLDDQAALVVDELQHQIVSANVLYNPATEGTNPGTNPDNGSAIAAGFSLRIYTQVNGTATCAQWRVLDTGEVESRSWTDTNPPTGVRPWTMQMTGVVNPASTPPFTLDPSTGYGGRVLNISLQVETGTTKASAVTLGTAVTARNAQFYQPNNDDTADCTPVPTP